MGGKYSRGDSTFWGRGQPFQKYVLELAPSVEDPHDRDGSFRDAIDDPVGALNDLAQNGDTEKCELGNNPSPGGHGGERGSAFPEPGHQRCGLSRRLCRYPGGEAQKIERRRVGPNDLEATLNHFA